MTKKKVFNEYTAELEVYTEDGEPRSDCFIESPCGNYTASLACALGEGILSGRDGDEPIADHVVENIEKWALSNGY